MLQGLCKRIGILMASFAIVFFSSRLRNVNGDDYLFARAGTSRSHIGQQGQLFSVKCRRHDTGQAEGKDHASRCLHHKGNI